MVRAPWTTSPTAMPCPTARIACSDPQLATHQVHIASASGRQFELGGLLPVKQPRIQGRIGMNAHGRLPGSRNARELTSLVGGWHRHLLVARLDAQHIGLDPDLEKMRDVFMGVVELAVLHATTRTHALHITRGNPFDMAHAVAVREFARQHVADDFHVAMAVRAKPRAGCDAVLVDHPQVAPPHVGRIVVASERKAVKRLEPTVIGISAVLGTAQCDHANLLNKAKQQQPKV